MLVEAVTDNRNRTGSDVRHIFSKHGGSLGEPGSVAYLFDKTGVIRVDGTKWAEDDLLSAIDAGANDIERDEDVLEVLCDPPVTSTVRAALEGDQIEILASELAYRPSTSVSVEEDKAGTLLKLMEALEDNDDVDAVHANFDLDPEVLARLSAE